MAYLRIRNWKELQHYKDRDPPWIKLHRNLLTSQTWVSLDDASRVLAIALMVLAAGTGNRIPADPAYLRRVAYLNGDPDWTPLVRTQFVDLVEDDESTLAPASAPLAKRTECSSEERRGETETEHTQNARARSARGKEREGFGKPNGFDAQRDHEAFQHVKAAYPKFAGRQDWIHAELACHNRIEQDGADWPLLIAAAERYAAYNRALGRDGTNFVMSPGKFYSAADEPWKQPWEIPPEQPTRGRARSGSMTHADVMAALDAAVDPNSEDFA